MSISIFRTPDEIKRSRDKNDQNRHVDSVLEEEPFVVLSNRFKGLKEKCIALKKSALL